MRGKTAISINAARIASVIDPVSCRTAAAVHAAATANATEIRMPSAKSVDPKIFCASADAANISGSPGSIQSRVGHSPNSIWRPPVM